MMDAVKQKERESGGGGIQGNQLTSDRKQRPRVLPLNPVKSQQARRPVLKVQCQGEIWLISEGRALKEGVD